jgi:hypothetical protein
MGGETNIGATKMTAWTDFITAQDPTDWLTHWYVLVDDAYQALERSYGRWRRRGPAPRFSDSEVITVGLYIDTLYAGHEALGLAQLRRTLPGLFPRLLPNGQFNARRRQLGPIMEQIRQYLTIAWHLIDPDDPDRNLDSLPVPVCTFKRSNANRSWVGQEYYGVMPSRRAKLYGLRLHVTMTRNFVLDQWLLAPASYRDSKVMAATLEGAHDLVVYADNAFRDPVESHHLKRDRNIQLWAPPRARSADPWPAAFARFANRTRRRIETGFSVLATAFHIEQPGARSPGGLVTRVASRLLPYTLSLLSTWWFPLPAA